MRIQAKRDAVEPSIVGALRRYGVLVWHLSGPGQPDLLTCYRGRWLPLEVKSARGRLTARQQGIRWPVVRSVEDALIAIGVRVAP